MINGSAKLKPSAWLKKKQEECIKDRKLNPLPFICIGFLFGLITAILVLLK